MKILSRLVSSIAVFNLLRMFFDVGLNGIIADLVSYYQAIFYPIIKYVDELASWAIPEWNYDLIIMIALLNSTHAWCLANEVLIKHKIPNITDKDLPKMKWSLAYRYGLWLPFFYYTGAEIKIGYDYSNPVSMKRPLLIATIFTYTYYMLLTIIIPYVRVFGVFCLVCIVIRNTLMAFNILQPEGEEERIVHNIFMFQYIWTTIGCILFFFLNLYAPSI